MNKILQKITRKAITIGLIILEAAMIRLVFFFMYKNKKIDFGSNHFQITTDIKVLAFSVHVFINDKKLIKKTNVVTQFFFCFVL